MRTEEFHAEDLTKLLRKRKVATIVQLKQALGTDVDMTVFRKLKQMDYLFEFPNTRAETFFGAL